MGLYEDEVPSDETIREMEEAEIEEALANADDEEDLGDCEECGEPLDKDCQGEIRCPNCDGPCPHCSDGGLDESMDGDFDTGMASAGFGTDEDYGGGDTPFGEALDGGADFD